MTYVLISLHSLKPFDQQYYGTQDMLWTHRLFLRLALHWLMRLRQEKL